MPGEDVSQRRWPSGDDRRFYVQRGVPLVPIATFLFAIGMQTVLGVRYISGLEAKVESQGKSQVELASKMDKFEAKLDTVALQVQQGSVPAALNQRAITDLERQISRLEARVEESERRQTGIAARERAGRER